MVMKKQYIVISSCIIRYLIFIMICLSVVSFHFNGWYYHNLSTYDALFLFCIMTICLHHGKMAMEQQRKIEYVEKAIYCMSLLMILLYEPLIIASVDYQTSHLRMTYYTIRPYFIWLNNLTDIVKDILSR